MSTKACQVVIEKIIKNNSDSIFNSMQCSELSALLSRRQLTQVLQTLAVERASFSSEAQGPSEQAQEDQRAHGERLELLSEERSGRGLYTRGCGSGL